MSVYVIGKIRIIDPEHWSQYKSQVQMTLEPYGGKVLLRGSCIDSFVGKMDYPDIVAIEFESAQKAKSWYNSSASRRDGLVYCGITVHSCICRMCSNRNLGLCI